MDVRDKLLFEPEYAGNIKEKVPPRSSLRIPWAWLSSALCLLQEVRYNILLHFLEKCSKVNKIKQYHKTYN